MKAINFVLLLVLLAQSGLSIRHNLQPKFLMPRETLHSEGNTFAEIKGNEEPELLENGENKKESSNIIVSNEDGEQAPALVDPLVDFKAYLEQTKSIQDMLFQIAYNKNATQKAVHSLAKAFDINQNGQIDESEFVMLGNFLVKLIGISIPNQYIKSAYYDSDLGNESNRGSIIDSLQKVAKLISREISRTTYYSFATLTSDLFNINFMIDHRDLIQTEIDTFFHNRTEVSAEEFKEILGEAFEYHEIPMMSQDFDWILQLIDKDKDESVTNFEVIWAFISYVTAVRDRLKPQIDAYNYIFSPVQTGESKIDEEKKYFTDYYTVVLDKELGEEEQGPVFASFVELYRQYLEKMDVIIEKLWSIHLNNKEAEKLVPHLGKLFDEDHDEKLSRDEFQKLVAKISKVLKIEFNDFRINIAFQFVDTDDNGKLDIHEGRGLLQFISAEIALAIEQDLLAQQEHFRTDMNRIEFLTQDPNAIRYIVEFFLGDKSELSPDDFKNGLKDALDEKLIPLAPQDSDILIHQFNIDIFENMNKEQAIEKLDTLLKNVQRTFSELIKAFDDVISEIKLDDPDQEIEEEKELAIAGAQEDGTKAFKKYLLSNKQAMYALNKVAYNETLARNIAHSIKTKLDKDNHTHVGFDEFEKLAKYANHKWNLTLRKLDLQNAYDKIDQELAASLSINSSADVLQFVAKTLSHQFATDAFYAYTSLTQGIEDLENIIEDKNAIEAELNILFGDEKDVSQEEFKSVLERAILTHKLPITIHDSTWLLDAFIFNIDGTDTVGSVLNGLIHFFTTFKSSMVQLAKTYEEVYAPQLSKEDIIEYKYYEGNTIISSTASVDHTEEYKFMLASAKQTIQALYHVYYDNENAKKLAFEFGTVSDLDEDGKLDIIEFKQLAAQLSHELQFPITDGQVTVAFHLADANDDNKVNLHEGVALIQFVSMEIADAMVNQLYQQYVHFSSIVNLVDLLLHDLDTIEKEVQILIKDEESDVKSDSLKSALSAAINRHELPFEITDADFLFQVFDADLPGAIAKEEVKNAFAQVLIDLKEKYNSMMDAFKTEFPHNYLNEEISNQKSE